MKNAMILYWKQIENSGDSRTAHCFLSNDNRNIEFNLGGIVLGWMAKKNLTVLGRAFLIKKYEEERDIYR